MKITVYFTDEVRKSLFVTEGLELRIEAEMEVPILELTQQHRRTLADHGRLMLPRYKGWNHYIDEDAEYWKSPIYPRSVEEWGKLLGLYEDARVSAMLEARANKAEHQAELDANSASFLADPAARVHELSAKGGGVMKWKELPLSKEACAEAKVRYQADQDNKQANVKAAREKAFAEFLANPDARGDLSGDGYWKIAGFQVEDDAVIKEAHRRRGADIEAAKADREAWIAENGSDYLKKAHAANYNCQRVYITERAALEFPGFIVDFSDDAGWKDRSCPSEAALDQALRVKGKVVWLTDPGADVRKALGFEYDTQSDWEDPWTDREAVVIEDYMGKYDLIKVMD